jgi:hypothetical protein
LGETLDAAPHAGLAQGRTSDAKPALILRAGGQGNVSRGRSPVLSRSPLRVSAERGQRGLEAGQEQTGSRIWSLGVTQVQPRQPLFREYVPGGLKARGVIKCTDMEMRFGRQTHAFTGQC